MSVRRARRLRRLPKAPHIDNLKKNLEEVNRLLEIHVDVSGSGPGRKRNVQVLNKSALIMLLACWESYVEDAAENCFDFMLNHANRPSVFPEHVLALAAKEVKKSDPSRVWGLAGEGWRDELKRHKQKILDKYIVKGSFNTPSSANIDRLYSELVGLKSLSAEWFWPKMSNDKAKAKLEELIDLRGSIAHRVEASRTVYKKDVEFYKRFISRLAVITHNRATALVYVRTGHRPWRRYRHGKTT